MQHSAWFRLWLWAAVAAVGLLLDSRTTPAVEPCRPFLEALREHQLYDVALDYLEQMRTSRLAPPEFKELIDYEKAVVLIAGLHTVSGLPQREEQLNQAQESLNAFLGQHPQHLLASGAQAQLGDVMLERARLKRELAQRSGHPPAERGPLLDDARKLAQQAQKAFTEAERQFDAAHQKLGKVDPSDSRAVEMQTVLRRDLLHARLTLASVPYELAQTYDTGSRQRRELLIEAAGKFGELYEKYKPRLAAYYARLGEARCYRELNEPKKAAETVLDAVEQEDDQEPFRVLRDKALTVLLETYSLPSVKNYKDAVARVDAWLKTAPPSQQASPEGLAIKYLGGVAWLERARSLKEADENKAEALNNARRLLTAVSRQEGEYRQQARNRLADGLLGGKAAAREPTTFEEAEKLGEEAVERMAAVEAQDKLEAGEGNTKDHSKHLEEIAQAREDALRYLVLALELAPQTLSEEQLASLNKARYYLAYLYWSVDRLYEAAVMGEFLARRYPASADASQAAKIAMAAYMRLYGMAPPGEGRQFESQQMATIADLITKRWPGQAEADDAWMMLVRTAVQGGELDKAVQYVKNVPAASPRRGEAELLAGQAFWAAYVKAAQADDEQRPKPAELEKMIQQAETTLETGVARLRKGVEGGTPVTTPLLNAILSLAQIAISTGQPQKAVTLLEDPKAGPLALLAQKSPVASEGIIPVETYKAALRAYVGAQQLDKAERAMRTLEQLVGQKGDAESNRRLTLIYIRLGQELQGQLERLRNEQKLEDLAKVSRGFELFLTQVSQREEGNTYHSLSWVAETFYGLGSGFDPGGGKLPPEAENYYQKAAETYRRILKRCQAEPGFAPGKEALLSIQVRLSRCLRRLGQFKEALDILVEILKQRSTMLAGQVEAAYTYQAWGDDKPTYYQLAIVGGRPQKRPDGSEANVVWGWHKISNMVQRYPEHLAIFHEARYNIALCRAKLSRSLSGPEKDQTLKDAERDIRVVQVLYPDMGGPDWYSKYDALLKKIQELRGVKPAGLKGNASATAEAPAAAASK